MVFVRQESLLACIFLSVFLCVPCRAAERLYYVAAVEEVWDYASPGGGDRTVENDSYLAQESDWKIFLQQGPDRIGSRYKKVMFREYTDGNFTEQKPREPWMGFLGPILVGERDDVIKVVFKNMAGRKYSMHPHGVQYNKSNEGAPYQDKTNDADRLDDAVPPGGQYVYEWQVTDQASPTEDDEECLAWVYHSHVDTVRDTNTGLLGILLTCKPGTLATLKERYTQFALLLNVVDENKSWLLDENIQTFCLQPNTVDQEDAEFQESNKMHGINGKVFGHLDGLQTCAGSTILWHMVGFGNEADLHSLSISGHSFLTNRHRQDAVSLNPVDFVTATTMADVPGRWRIKCNIHDHLKAGMLAFLDVNVCPDRPLPRLGNRIGQYRRYFIGIEEVDWNYAPSGRNLFEGGNLTEPGSQSETYFKQDSQHVGGSYRKALYREYTDMTFDEPKKRSPDEEHLGFLGPVLRAEVGDSLVVTLRNQASFPFSIHPHGATFIKFWEGALYKDGSNYKQDDFVAPGSVKTNYWLITDNMGPGPLDPPCITRMYTSSSRDLVRDSYSGLVGPILICRQGSLDANLKQRQVDREFFLMFSVTDENKSWYRDLNFLLLNNESFIDEEFAESNLMHGINGYLYGNLPGLNMCLGDRVVWHVFSIGSEADVHTVYFHGQSLTVLDTHRSSTAILPGYFKTLFMKADNPGQWAVVCRTNDHYKAGTKALFKVSDCDLQREYNIKPLVRGRNRTYFLQAEEGYWDYAPGGMDRITGKNLSDPSHEGYIFTRSDGAYLGSRYKKVRYHQYTDATFTSEIQRDSEEQYLGILGPVLVAEAYDTITIIFRNNASRPYSVHAQGLFYSKESEGAPYAANMGGAVLPSMTKVYTWSVPSEFAPSKGDPPCINQAYYSAVDPVKDTNSGLIGSLVLCKQGVLTEAGKRTDVSRSYVALFEVFDENESWYLEDNINEFGNASSKDVSDFEESNLLHGINGYLYGTSPEISVTQNTVVAWHLMTLGSEVDIHSVHFHANDVIEFESGRHAKDVTQLFPGVFTTVHMNATNPGYWLLHCHVHDHILAGMQTIYVVAPPVVTVPDYGEIPPN